MVEKTETKQRENKSTNARETETVRLPWRCSALWCDEVTRTQRLTESSRQYREQRLMACNDTRGTEHTRNKRKPGEGPRFSLDLFQSCRFTCGRSLCLSCFPFICVHTCVKTNPCSLCSHSILQSSDSGTEYKLGGGSEEGKSLKYAEPFYSGIISWNSLNSFKGSRARSSGSFCS